jgi:hypothetical protein
MIERSWRAAKMENPQLDSFFRVSKLYIDTLGRHSDDATNLELYGSTNMDSVRKLLNFQLDSAFKMQMNTVKSTVFTFRKDSVAILYFDNTVDSCKWYFDQAGKLNMQPLYDTDLTNNLNIRVLALSDSVLRLKFIEEGSASIITFRPERK